MSTPQGDYLLQLRPPAAPGAAVPPPRPSSDPDAGPAPDTAQLAGRLQRVPKVAALGQGRYEFGERDAGGIMRIEVLADSVRVLIPRAWVPARGPQVFALVFMMAEWLSWDVHDPQIGGVLKKDVVLQGLVAMRQAQLAAAGTPVPKPVWNGPADAPRPPGMTDDDRGSGGRRDAGPGGPAPGGAAPGRGQRGPQEG